MKNTRSQGPAARHQYLGASSQTPIPMDQQPDTSTHGPAARHQKPGTCSQGLTPASLPVFLKVLHLNPGEPQSQPTLFPSGPGGPFSPVGPGEPYSAELNNEVTSQTAKNGTVKPTHNSICKYGNTIVKTWQLLISMVPVHGLHE